MLHSLRIALIPGGVVVGIQILHGILANINNNSGKKI
jgi:hypothetical protein